MLYKKCLVLGSIMALLAVAFGAFGAHGLKSIVEAQRVTIFETGVRYQYYHAFALLFTGILSKVFDSDSSPKHSWLRFSYWLFFVGIIFFSGSLYILTLRDVLPGSWTWVGPITPIGGTLLIIGWGFIFRFCASIDSEG